MRLHKLVVRNLGRRRLATVLTTISVALGVGLFAAIGALRGAAQEGFQRSASICDLVVGAPGSSLQLVLNSLYHIGLSPGNLPFAVYEELLEERGVLWTVPMAVGDSFRGQRIVGVTDSLFTQLEIPRGYGRLRFASGEPFAFGHDALVALHGELEAEAVHAGEFGEEHGEGHGEGHGEDHGAGLFVAVVGSQAAREADLSLGSRFLPVHDVGGGSAAERHEDAEIEVVGVLEPTGTPVDRAIYVPLAVFYLIQGHEPAEGTTFGGTLDPLGLSAVLVRTNPNTGLQSFNLWRSLRDRTDVQGARPAVEIHGLFQVVGNVDQVLRAVAALVVIVALVGVLVAIYNTMGSRRREFAVLRALGARRRTVLALVMGESAAIALLGGIAGLLLAGAGLEFASGRVRDLTGVSVSVAPGSAELVLLLSVTLVGALAGLVPALSAYRTEAARHLSAGG